MKTICSKNDNLFFFQSRIMFHPTTNILCDRFNKQREFATKINNQQIIVLSERVTF